MTTDDSNNFNADIHRQVVTSGAISALLPTGYNGKRVWVKKRTKPTWSKAAKEALSARIVSLFAEGLNTVEIAAKVNAKESKVYNILAELAE